jgi:hypothetical protein
MFYEKFSAGQGLFNETAFTCKIASGCERDYRLNLNLLVVTERKPDILIKCSTL